MASYTPNLNLLKKSPVTDGDDTFNVDTMLNENWDKIDSFASEVESYITESESKITDLTSKKVIISSGSISLSYSSPSKSVDLGYRPYIVLVYNSANNSSAVAVKSSYTSFYPNVPRVLSRAYSGITGNGFTVTGEGKSDTWSVSLYYVALGQGDY